MLKQTTGPIYPAMVYFIPGWADPELGGSVYTTFGASSVGGSTIFAAVVNRGESYTFAVTYNDSGYAVGIRTTRLPRPVALGILERAATSWVPIAGNDPRFTAATVYLQTATSAGSTIESYDLRRLGAESGGFVNVWPLLVGRDEEQEMVFSARLVDERGVRCCNTQFYLNARSDLVHLAASRFDAVWTPSDVTAASPPRVTDRRLIVKADYDSSRPVTMLLLPALAGFQSVELSGGSSSRSVVFNFPPAVTTVGDQGFPVEPGEHEVVLQVQDRDEVGNALTRELDSRQAVETALPRTAQGNPALSYAGAWECRYAVWAGTDFQGHHYSGGLHCTVPASSDRLDIDAPEIMSGTPNTPEWTGLPRGGCDNNPCAQCYRERTLPGHHEGGPIPAGRYKISAGYVDLERPYVTYRVEPVPPNDMCGRNSILIHFGIPESIPWSTGCIVTDRTDLKDMLAKYGGGTLEVVNGDGFDLARCPDPHLGQGYTGGAFCSGLQPTAPPP